MSTGLLFEPRTGILAALGHEEHVSRKPGLLASNASFPIPLELYYLAFYRPYFFHGRTTILHQSQCSSQRGLIRQVPGGPVQCLLSPSLLVLKGAGFDGMISA